MQRILILGGNGMIGHQLLKSYQDKFIVKTTLKQNESVYIKHGLFNKNNSFFNIDAKYFFLIEKCIVDFKPDIVINAIGITKKNATKKNHNECKVINSELPIKLAELSDKIIFKLIHLSTDCVFSGNKGMYSETDLADCNDIYGLSKINGEIDGKKNVLTLRKSTIGFEIGEIKHGLLEWALSMKGTIYGYKKAIFSGVTTLELSKIIEFIILNNINIYGIWHVASEPINKYDLLRKIQTLFIKDDLSILLEESYVCDRSLNSLKFNKFIKYVIPTWDQMLKELVINNDKC